MIHVICPGSHAQAETVVLSALARSCGTAQVQIASPASWARQLEIKEPAILVAVEPPDGWSKLIIRTIQQVGSKVLLFGSVPSTLAQFLDIRTAPLNDSIRRAALCPPAPIHAKAESDLGVEYLDVDKAIQLPIKHRPFLRYDFADEWNNLGYGAIRADGSIWSLMHQAQLPDGHCLARAMLGSGQVVGAYAGLWATDTCLLWFNRPVGPVDSVEWRIVEQFLASYGWPRRPCQPVISEIPYGFKAAVTMRLDCDEGVESARALWRAYQEMQVPFSLALHSKVLADDRNHLLPREVLSHGGAILSHSATHAENWGGTYESALGEASISADQIAKAVGYRPRYAVSPFHQTPMYARKALADVGYQGCIGGIVRNDPDFLMGRSGIAPGSCLGFVGHSQQCMLHGDCMVFPLDPLGIYKSAFDAAVGSRTFFGYLDHPFSERYQYGWESETQRIGVHGAFISYMKGSGQVLFANEDDALDFLLDRTTISIAQDGTQYIVKVPTLTRTSWTFGIEYGDVTHALSSSGLKL